MRRNSNCAILSMALAVVAAGPFAVGGVVDYDIVYVRQARFGDDNATMWPEVFHPARAEVGADLMLLHPDGSEEVLVTGGDGSVTDPYVSFDAKWVYYALFHDLREENLNYQRDYLPNYGSDIYRINLDSREVQQLTHGEFTPNTGGGHFDESNPLDPGDNYDRLGYGILNLGPCPVPGGKVAFTSNRNGQIPPKSYTNPTLQLFVMDEDGANVTAIAPMTIGSALHPVILRDGRILFSSFESQGLRDQRMWGMWSIYPDGRHWSPVVSAFHDGQAFHFAAQLTDEDLIVDDYYNLNNNGFGALYRLPIKPPAGEPRFFSAFLKDNPDIMQTVGAGYEYPFRMPFTPRGLYSITPMTTGQDEAAPEGDNGVRVGKFTHPCGAPGGDLLVCWSPGPCNNLDRPTPRPYYDAGLYLVKKAAEVWSPDDLVLIKNDPNYNEAWPRPVVKYSDVFGVDEPDQLDWLPNDGSIRAELPAGTPYGLIGTSSFYKRESFPGVVPSWSDTFDGLDAFNTDENGQSSNWVTQGADAGKYTNEEIWAVRILVLEGSSHRSYGPHEGIHFANHANEKLRILGEIPLRKFDGGGNPILDDEGNPDTSFLAKVPADTPLTFQMINRNGMNLTMAQTWHQVRPGEARYDCGGCHAHSQLPLDFHTTYAAGSDYVVPDLTKKKTPLITKDENGDPAVRIVDAPVVDVEFYRDIRPILQRSCTSCHTKDDQSPPGKLVLDDTKTYQSDNYVWLPGDYKRLADDWSAKWGYKPVIYNETWRQTNASRYIRAFQSRRSMLMWKIFGERTDGWSNDEHPTESTPGDRTTLPKDADVNDADLDFTGTMMPPPDSDAPKLSEDEKMLFARWIDLGCPINIGEEYGMGDWGWFLDEQRPTLTVTLPRAGENAAPLDRISIGFADANSGIEDGSLSVKSSIAIAGRAANVELADLFSQVDDGIYELALDPLVVNADAAHLKVSVKDVQGNITRVDRKYSVKREFDGRGDMNCDHAVDFNDIDPFVVALISRDKYEQDYPGCAWLNGDIDRDYAVNFADIDGFVDCLIGGACR